MRTNKLIHLYEMAGDKSHSSFLMWTMSGFSQYKLNQAANKQANGKGFYYTKMDARSFALLRAEYIVLNKFT